MTSETPVLFLKTHCPHCLKLRVFLLDAGLLGRFELREFTPGDDREAAIRGELAPHFAKVSFPTVRLAPGRYLNESDDIIAHYAREAGIDPADLPVFQDYLGGIFTKLRAVRLENAELKRQLVETDQPAAAH